MLELSNDMGTIIKWFISMGVAVVAWFCKGIISTQKQTDEALHKHSLDLAAVKLDIAQNYHTKADAAIDRQETNKHLERIHERLDKLPLDIISGINGVHK